VVMLPLTTTGAKWRRTTQLLEGKRGAKEQAPENKGEPYFQLDTGAFSSMLVIV